MSSRSKYYSLHFAHHLISCAHYINYDCCFMFSLLLSIFHFIMYKHFCIVFANMFRIIFYILLHTNTIKESIDTNTRTQTLWLFTRILKGLYYPNRRKKLRHRKSKYLRNVKDMDKPGVMCLSGWQVINMNTFSLSLSLSLSVNPLLTLPDIYLVAIFCQSWHEHAKHLTRIRTLNKSCFVFPLGQIAFKCETWQVKRDAF